jgi:hypothetical protein
LKISKNLEPEVVFILKAARIKGFGDYGLFSKPKLDVLNKIKELPNIGIIPFLTELLT